MMEAEALKKDALLDKKLSVLVPWSPQQLAYAQAYANYLLGRRYDPPEVPSSMSMITLLYLEELVEKRLRKMKLL